MKSRHIQPGRHGEADKIVAADLAGVYLVGQRVANCEGEIPLPCVVVVHQLLRRKFGTHTIERTPPENRE